jgi:hypothetical protein
VQGAVEETKAFGEILRDFGNSSEEIPDTALTSPFQFRLRAMRRPVNFSLPS